MVCGGLHEAVIVQYIDRDEGPRKQALAALQDLVEHRLRIGDRAADGAEDFAGSALLLERFPGLIEQSHVLDRDHRLIGEGLEQIYQGRWRLPRLAPSEDNDP